MGLMTWRVPRHRMPFTQESRVQNAFDDGRSTVHQSLDAGAGPAWEAEGVEHAAS